MISINFIERQRRSVSKKQWFVLVLIVLVAFLAFLFIRYQLLPNKKQLNSLERIQHPENVVLPSASVGELKLSGIVLSGKKRWALVATKDQQVEKVQQGDFVGTESMKVDKITTSSVEFSAPNKGKKLLEIRGLS